MAKDSREGEKVSARGSMNERNGRGEEEERSSVFQGVNLKSTSNKDEEDEARSASPSARNP